MRVLGIDPGTLRTGIGVIDKKGDEFIPVHFEIISAEDRSSLAKKLKKIYDCLTEVFKIYRPQAVALETIFYSKNFKTAMKIGEARAVAMLAAVNFGLEVNEYSPARVKEAVTGYGRASKIQIQNMIKRILRLKDLPPVDSADALALAICHLNTKRALNV